MGPLDRRRFLGIAAATAAVPALTRLPQAYAAPAPVADAPAPTESPWHNVRIDGGGFVPGIIFSQTRKDLIYARTDIGGAYRWDANTSSWTPLLDWVGADRWGWNGVVSVAIDESAPDKVYAAVGMYTNSWDPGNGAVLRSGDLGANWQAAELPFKLGGNMPGRGMGERLAVDPNAGNVLYLGAPSGNGLWRSTNGGVSWAKVASFPNPGTYRSDPNDSSGYGSDIQGVVWVTFDRTTGSAGTPSRTIYAGVADPANTVYRSTDAGATWSRLAGQPTGYLAHKGVLDHVNQRLYLATSDTGGPYDGGKGDVWRYDVAAASWTRISPIPSESSDDYFGYSGLTIDRTNPSTIMVATQVSWWPDAIVFRSKDAGATWTRIWDWTGYPARSYRYTMDITSVPWLSFGASPAPPEVAPKLGWMNESLEIDPHDPDRMMYGTGATIYGTTDLRTWDTGGQITIRPAVKGLEETAVLDLISPPTGPALFSALGDIGGFAHTSLTSVPAMMYTQPNYTSTTSMDFAELQPAVLARVGNIDREANPQVNRAAFSTNGGSSWFQASAEPGGVTGGGTIAVAADGQAAVWSPQGAAVQRTTTYGSSWTPVTGLPQGALVRADRVSRQRFYAYAGGKFYASTDGGASFTATAATGLPAQKAAFKPVPGKEGEIFLTGEGGMWRSLNGGASFTAVAGVTKGVNLGYGKAAPEATQPAIYLAGTVNGVAGVHASDNAGATWRRVNDDRHQYGNMGDAITGDPRVYGRVYLGTNGRGILFADVPADGRPTDDDIEDPTVPTDLRLTAVTADSATLTWTASTDDTGVTGYDIYRDGAQVGQSTTPAFTDTGLAASSSYQYRVRSRDSVPRVSELSAPITVVTAPDTRPTGALTVRYRNADSSATDNAIRMSLQVVNSGTGPVDLAGVTLRYWFAEPGSATYQTFCDWAQLGSAKVTHRVVAAASPKTGASHYLEVGFTSAAGPLAAGASTGEIQLRVHKGDWSAFDEADDYSRGTNTSFADAPKVGAYLGGALVWGTAP
ncbi:Xyloglucanase [Streptomyces sp. RB5]|uniref:Xyloglucanase n=1 Tax=Streptomyces smaragdinus TaxID=2585196 RepID=A0A7K0CGN1_9ACTN|nr:cellulose binding domain-containing protein [Streptomyces smaragdinus]MQY12598.1 Xyloglucanase [Streptomyces smaragdinus]